MEILSPLSFWPLAMSGKKICGHIYSVEWRSDATPNVMYRLRMDDCNVVWSSLLKPLHETFMYMYESPWFCFLFYLIIQIKAILKMYIKKNSHHVSKRITGIYRMSQKSRNFRTKLRCSQMFWTSVVLPNYMLDFSLTHTYQ